MTNGNNFSNQDRANRARYEADRQRANQLTDQTTPATVYDEDGQPIVERESVSARPVTRDEVNYRNGYVEGQNQQRIHEDIRRTRAENSAATGTLIGLLIASIAGLVLAALYFLPGNREPQVTPAPATSPTQPRNDNQPQSTERTIIERVREVPASPENTQIIVPPSSPQPAPTQPSVIQPSLTQPDASELPSQTNPDTVPGSVPDSSVTDPVDPAIPADPNQSLSQPDTTLDGTTSGGTSTTGQ